MKTGDAIRKIVILLVITAVWLNGCSGSGSDAPQPLSEVKTGYFLDSAVKGLSYATATQQGITDVKGAFSYKEGERVTFSIGKTVVGQSIAKPIITPIDLAGESADITHPSVAVICRLLQSLDTDNDPENGIDISEPVSGLVSTFIRTLNTISDLETDIDIQNLFAELNRTGVFSSPRSLRSKEQAIRHMKQTLAYSVNGISISGKPYEFISAVTSLYGTGVLAPAPSEAPDKEVEREIEEADIIKLEGTFLYILNRYRGLVICDISQPDNPSITSRLSVKGDPKEMYIRGQQAYILTYFYESDFDIASGGSIHQGTRLYIIDIAEKSHPLISSTFILKGYINESRIVGDMLYAVCTETPSVVVPALETTQIQVPETWMASFDLSNPANIRQVDELQFGGSVSQIHVTESAVFIASNPAYKEKSSISYVDISDASGKIVKRGAVEIAGNILDKFKINYSSGYLRVCTYDWNNTGISRLFIIDVRNPDSPAIVSSLELGKGEQLFATRFDADKAYLVTFERKDPLWIIDLKNPEKPEIKAELIVPGWSTYIEPLGDRLITLGVDDTSGQKVSVSLFDVSDPSAPSLLKRLSFGDESGWSSSSAYSDVKSFTVLKDMGLILLPYTVSGPKSSGTESRLQLIDFSSAALGARGWIVQKGEVLRSRSASDRLFSVSADELKVIDASDRDHPKITATRSIAENMIDFACLTHQTGVRVLSEPDGGLRLQSVPISDPESDQPIGEISIEPAYYSGLFSNGNLTYLVTAASSGYPYDLLAMPAFYQRKLLIQTIDFSSPAQPVARGKLEIEGISSSPAPLLEGMAIYPFYEQPKILRLKSDVLVYTKSASNIRPYDSFYTKDDSSSLISDADPKDDGYSGTVVIVLDMTNPVAPRIASKIQLTVSFPSEFLLKNNVLYFSYPKSADKDASGRDTVKYYLGRIDLSDYQNPKELKEINIPGICVGFDAEGGIAFTANSQWEKDQIKTTLNAVKIQNDLAYLLSEVPIENGYSKLVIADGYAYLTGYTYRYISSPASSFLNIVDLADPQKPILYKNPLTAQWIDIIGADRSKVFINTSGGTACIDASKPDSIRIDDFRSHSGYPDRIHFDTNAAYIPLGYYGVWVKHF